MRWSGVGASHVGSTLLFGLLILLRLTGFVAAQTTNASCISLNNSKMCQNFSSASISTNLTTNFPFLQFVSNVDQFDTQFAQYITQDYAKYTPWRRKHSNRVGRSTRKYCSAVALTFQTQHIYMHGSHGRYYVLR